MHNTSSVEGRRSILLELGFEQTPQPARSRVTRLGRRSYRIDAVRAAMGTRVVITAIDRSPDRLEEAVGCAFEEMDRLVAIFTRYEAASPVTRLNDDGRVQGPPPELVRVLDRAGRYHALTRGAFDVSVAPLVDLFSDRFADPAATPPSDAEIAEARALVGARHIEMSPGSVRLRRQGMRLTLDGIAKGYIVDGMADALERRRVRRYLIDGGGDIRTRGRRPDRRPWTVAVRHPFDAATFLDTVRPGRGAVATSGSYERFYDDDRRFHHLVDAGTGLSPGHVAGASVVARTAMAADALATAVFVLGPVAGLRLIDSLAGCACVILDGDGRRLTSRGWQSAPPRPDSLE